MPQTTASPTRPCKATQRAGLQAVPRIVTRFGLTGPVSSGGTVPPSEGSASLQ